MDKKKTFPLLLRKLCCRFSKERVVVKQRGPCSDVVALRKNTETTKNRMENYFETIVRRYNYNLLF